MNRENTIKEDRVLRGEVEQTGSMVNDEDVRWKFQT